MTLYNKRKKRLFKELKDKEYRDAFVEQSINIGIPFQIKTLREQREWTQKQFEEYSGIKQPEISRYESIDYTGFTLKSLNKFASAFDVGLVVRFVPISDLVEWELNLTPKSLEVLSYKDDPYFKNEIQDEILNRATADVTTVTAGISVATSVVSNTLLNHNYAHQNTKLKLAS